MLSSWVFNSLLVLLFELIQESLGMYCNLLNQPDFFRVSSLGEGCHFTSFISELDNWIFYDIVLFMKTGDIYSNPRKEKQRFSMDKYRLLNVSTKSWQNFAWFYSVEQLLSHPSFCFDQQDLLFFCDGFEKHNIIKIAIVLYPKL